MCFAKEAEPDEAIKSLLLSVFVIVDFPLEAKALYPFIENGGSQLAGTTVSVLERICNKDIHDFTFTYLSNGGKYMRVLDLLVKNHSNQYEELIRKILFKSKIADHNVQMAVRDFC